MGEEENKIEAAKAVVILQEKKEKQVKGSGPSALGNEQKKPKPEKEKKTEVKEPEFNLKETLSKIKMPMYLLAIAFGVFGIIGTIILVLLSFPIIDNIEVPITTQIEDITGLIGNLEAGVVNVEGQLDTFNKSIKDFGTTITGMKSGFKNTGEALIDFGDAVDGISLGPLAGLSQYSTKMKNAGNSFILTTDSLGEVEKNIEKQNIGLSDLKQKISAMRGNVIKQKNDLVSAKEAIGQTFNSMRLVVIIFGLLLVILYLGVIALAVAGLGT
ncbi:hypothetical protein J4450_05620 [Candidatus Micrarchaeota archaeon]|nr:hypothetical protein [Candidatus Micrarchaeota archaeon]